MSTPVNDDVAARPPKGPTGEKRLGAGTAGQSPSVF